MQSSVFPNATPLSPPILGGPEHALNAADAARRLDDLAAGIARLSDTERSIREGLGLVAAQPEKSQLQIFHGYIAIFVVAFLVTLLVTPLMRRLAVANGIIDRPNEARKIHRAPVAYLGGVAVYLGILAAICFSYVALFGILPFDPVSPHVDDPAGVPLAVVMAMTAIMIIGLFDDVQGISPRVKIGGQLLTAALLAFFDIGVKVAEGILTPIGRLFNNEKLLFDIAIPFTGLHTQFDAIYWAGTAIIAIFVLGACNASNLIDGLDGLLSGVTAIAMGGLLIIALAMAATNDGRLDAARIVLILAVLGACLGFLPHNFNPASIFLGDAGSMLLGFSAAVVILTLGDTGKTHLVVAGLIVYAVPIIDTTLAIIRRKLSGKSISAADDQHLHHQLRRSLGVKGAALTLYGIAAVFAGLGVALSLGRGRVVYALALVMASFIAVTAFKIARRERFEQEAIRVDSRPAPPARDAGATREPFEAAGRK